MLTLHEHLLKLDKQEDSERDSICFFLSDSYYNDKESRYFSDTQDAITLKLLISEWPEHSGNKSYPVAPCKDASELSCSQTFWYARRTYALWIGEYGEARKRLLAYLIERTKP